MVRRRIRLIAIDRVAFGIESLGTTSSSKRVLCRRQDERPKDRLQAEEWVGGILGAAGKVTQEDCECLEEWPMGGPLVNESALDI